MSLRWKIAAVSLLLVFVPVYLLNRYAVDFFDRFTRTALEQRMVDHAFIAAEDYRALVREDGDDAEATEAFAERLARLGEEFETRLRIITPGGAVRFDSDPARRPDPTDDPPPGERPEVQRALAGRYGARAKLTPDRFYMYYFVALPVWDGTNVVAAACASRNTAPIIHAITEMHRNQWHAAALALVVTAALSVLFGQTLTRRLRRLTRRAIAFARGDRGFEAHPRGHDEIAELGRSIGDMAAEIARKNAYNREFLAATLHELKTPITAIRGATEVLESGADARPGARTKFLGNIRYESDRLVRMVEQLAALTRLDSEELRGRKEEVDYGAAVREILDRLDPAWPAPRARLVVELPDAPLRVRIVPARIEQVLANLLENAFRYTPPDGTVTVRVKPGPEGTVVTTIRDTGCGITPGDLPKVFDRFFTTEPKAQVRETGSGLGLAIARSIVENHGGRIEAESPPGEGATFRFSLPGS